MEKCAELLPLLDVLKRVEADDRLILLSYFDNETRDLLYETIVCVLQSDKVPLQKRLHLKRVLSPFKEELRHAAKQFGGGDSGSATVHFARAGGRPLGELIDAAIPLLVDFFSS